MLPFKKELEKRIEKKNQKMTIYSIRKFIVTEK